MTEEKGTKDLGVRDVREDVKFKLLNVFDKDNVDTVKSDLDNLYKELVYKLKYDKYSELGVELRLKEKKKKNYIKGAIGLAIGLGAVSYGIKKVVDGKKLKAEDINDIKGINEIGYERDE